MVTFDQTFIPTGGMELHFDENAEAESSPVHGGHCAHLAGFLLQLLHSVQGTASLKPLYLRLVEGVVQHDCFLAPIGMLDDAFQRLSRRKVCQPHDAQLVHRMNLVVVRWVSESERQ